MKFYQHWIGDYQGATKRLSLLEHGAYRLLLDEYYSTEEPLPADLMQLHRICSAFASEEQAAVHSVLHQFFTSTEKGWTHERVEAEIIKSRQVSEKRKKSAEKRWGKDASADANAHANAMQNGCYPQPQPQPQPNRENKSLSSGKPDMTLTLEFITDQDRKDWKALFPDVDHDSVIKRAALYRLEHPDRRADDTKIRDWLVLAMKKEQEKILKTRMVEGWFGEIWGKYPRKDGRKEALRHFRATVQTEADWEDINKALDNYLLRLQAEGTESRFIKTGSTRFNNWRDWVEFDPTTVRTLDARSARVAAAIEEIDRIDLDAPRRMPT